MYLVLSLLSLTMRKPKLTCGIGRLQDASDFYQLADGHASTRMTMNYTLYKGVSIQLHDLTTADESVARIAAMPSVKAIHPVRTYYLPPLQVISTVPQGRRHVDLMKRQETSDTFSTHQMTQIDMLHKRGISGRGIKIAVVDSGIDYMHPALGECFGPGCLISYGTDLVGDSFTGSGPVLPDDDPMDCSGHGTHVAGIIAAQDNPFGIKGAAPNVTLGAYKVFGCGNSVTNDVLIAAFNQAYEDGSDIITSSIGGVSGFMHESWAVAVSRIVDAGVPCTLISGNDGSMGMFYGSSAASGKNVIAVASFDNLVVPSLVVEGSYTVGSEQPKQFVFTPGEPLAWPNSSLSLWAPTFNSSDPIAQGCDPFAHENADLRGHVVLLKRGTCPFSQKAVNAAAIGASYIMLYNDAPGTTTVSADASTGIQGVGVTTPEYGAIWLEALANGQSVKLTVGPTRDLQVSNSLNNGTGGYVSTWSSWGPNFDGLSKPQIGAVGGNVLSLYPRALGTYAVLSGTSMAYPQVAGILALIAEAKKTLDPATLEALIVANAKPSVFHDGLTPLNLLAPVAQQGGGLIQAYDAAFASTLLNVASLSFNDTVNASLEQDFTIQNLGLHSISYRLSHLPAASAYTFAVAEDIDPMSFPNDLTSEHGSLSFSETNITIQPGQTVRVSVTGSPPNLDARRLPVWSGFILLEGSDQSTMRLPYQGILGSLSDHQVLKSALMTTTDSPDFAEIPSNYTFILPGPNVTSESSDSLPGLIINLSFGSPHIRAELVPITMNAPNRTTEALGSNAIGQIYTFPMEGVGRGMLPIAWEGRMQDGTYAPEGEYKMVIRALRIFGNQDRIEDYETAETGQFRIKYARNCIRREKVTQKMSSIAMANLPAKDGIAIPKYRIASIALGLCLFAQFQSGSWIIYHVDPPELVVDRQELENFVNMAHKKPTGVQLERLLDFLGVEEVQHERSFPRGTFPWWTGPLAFFPVILERRNCLEVSSGISSASILEILHRTYSVRAKELENLSTGRTINLKVSDQDAQSHSAILTWNAVYISRQIGDKDRAVRNVSDGKNFVNPLGLMVMNESSAVPPSWASNIACVNPEFEPTSEALAVKVDLAVAIGICYDSSSQRQCTMSNWYRIVSLLTSMTFLDKADIP
ncbi:Minor extracellular protease vpr [Paramyrothecium foliicola]|nr:Minor extracellular protease vpr [Paramyrothecium foliicola]